MHVVTKVYLAQFARVNSPLASFLETAAMSPWHAISGLKKLPRFRGVVVVIKLTSNFGLSSIPLWYVMSKAGSDPERSHRLGTVQLLCVIGCANLSLCTKWMLRLHWFRW